MRWFRYRRLFAALFLLALWYTKTSWGLGSVATDEQQPATTTSSRAAATSMFVQVARVVDGDTIKVLLEGVTTTVRLIGVDTPETVKPKTPVQCYGPESSAETKTLIEQAGGEVLLAPDPTQSTLDEYGRTLAYVYLPDGTLLDEYLIAHGFGREYTFKGRSYQFQTQFRAAQRTAQEQQLGLWSTSTCSGGR